MSLSEKYPRLLEELEKCPKPSNLVKTLTYGTAGFRDDAELLKSTFFRIGMLALLRSRSQMKIIGLMVTASHNPVQDNGIKLVDPDGGMLDQSWEKYAEDLVNAETDKVIEILDSIVAAEKIDMEKTGNIFIAKDTRPSSEQLSELAREGALLVGGNVLDFGLLSTPQLHHLVRMWNFENHNKGDWASENGYYNMLIDGFKQLVADVDPKVLAARSPLYIDAAHGIGAVQVAKMVKDLSDVLKLEIRNIPSNGELNNECGAEYVQKGRKPPIGFDRDADRNKRCCSFDGDADRLVYHYFDDEGEWHLLDGDKIAALMASFLKEHLSILQLEEEVTFGTVQTAYANGASTSYVKKAGVDVRLAKTGVKYCHHEAITFDIGLYFEANGHGTVIFKDAFVEKMQNLESTLTDEKKKHSLAMILAAYQLINQAVGDAISDMFFVEALLAMRGWDIQTWDAIYRDLPSRQTKLAVADRTVVVCTEDETKVISPSGMQEKIDELASGVKHGRAFVRPSGTEDFIRVYAEADTQEEADNLALNVAIASYKLCGGVGEAPHDFKV